MKNIRPLKSEADYDWALAELEAYFDALPKPGSEAADRFDVLTDLVGAYEARHHPLDDLDPIDFLDGYMQNHGLGRADLAGFLGSVPRASEVLLRRRALTPAMIRRLLNAWSPPADALVGPMRLGRLRRNRSRPKIPPSVLPDISPSRGEIRWSAASLAFSVECAEPDAHLG